MFGGFCASWGCSLSFGLSVRCAESVTVIDSYEFNQFSCA
jgi:hypothetical protein